MNKFGPDLIKLYTYGVSAVLVVGLLMLVSCDGGDRDMEVAKAQIVETSNSRVEDLIAQMTLEEKVGQMAQITLDVITVGASQFESSEPVALDMKLVRKALLDHKVGSILNTANNRARTKEKWHEIIGALQDVAINESRLGIPIIYGVDAIHGTTYTAGATFFPQQIGQAATWNGELVRQAAEVTAYETRASAIPWNFSPVLDLGRDPRFPRMWETFGEDVHLASELGRQMIKGYQGDENQIDDNYRVAACLKHYLGYSVPNSGKDRTPAFIPETELRERHLKVFKAALEEGAQSVMVNSGLINGRPVHASKELLNDLLKEELGFTGVVVTDWKDIENLHSRDRIASTRKEAVKLAINAGIDMSMIPYDFDFCGFLVELVNDGEVSMTRIDDAVRRILTLKEDLGLFENPTPDLSLYKKFGSEEFEQLAFNTAAESITLLKNDDILPLSDDAKILVTGPNANSMRTLNGGWSYSWQGEKVEEFAGNYNTILEAVQNTFNDNSVMYSPGISYDFDGKYWEENEPEFDEVLKMAKEVDVVLLCLGENSYTEKPGDLHELSLSTNQLRLAKLLAETGKPTVLVLNQGRPRLIREIEPQMKGIIQMYLPGNFGADALAATLSGELNPSGKLPYTYPMYSNTLVTYDHKPSEEQNKMDGMYDYESDFAVQFPFGFGLSYTTFEYSDLSISSRKLNPQGEVEVSVSVKNVGETFGKEVVQLYVSDLYASITPDVKRLRGFKKISLKPGESKVVTFTVRAEDLSFVGEDRNWTVEAGEYKVQIEALNTEFSIENTHKYTARKNKLY